MQFTDLRRSKKKPNRLIVQLFYDECAKVKHYNYDCFTAAKPKLNSEVS